MTSSKFKNFLQNLGFSDNDFKEEPKKDFAYEIWIDETQSEKVRYIHTPTNDDIFNEHKRFWNRNNVNSFVAVKDDETYLIDTKVKPNKEKPLSSKIESFNYGINSEGFEKEKLQVITKDAIDATYFFDFVIKHRKKHQEVDKDLLLNLIALRSDLLKIKKNDQETIHLLILRCLFIKYLEDKGIYDKDHLILALNSGQPARLVEAFEEIKKINGDIFKFDRQVLENEIDKRYLKSLSQFFISDYRSGQGYLFPYLFDQIPIQLISNVYEAFLHNDKRQGKGIYYTPAFLVNFILSHSLIEKLKEKRDITVFDPAVGSGAFLVESFKAIVKPGDSYEKKKSILQNQLFGVDVDQDALQIAVFSLYLALIETERPEFIRKQIEISNPILPSLIGSNLIRANSLTDEVFKDRTFDCIVSNPPWGSAEPIDDNENRKERSAIATKGNAGTIVEYKNVSDYERSQAFLIRVKKWSNKNTIFSLVVKNSIFLNDNSEDFRKELLRTYQLNFFYELSNYNKILFRKRVIGEIDGQPIEIGATEPCAVLVFELPKKEDNKIRYISPKLHNFSENFQIIHYTQKDINEVKQTHFIEDDLLWRVLVKGDFEDYELIKRKFSTPSTFSVECRSGFKATSFMKPTGDPDFRELVKPNDFARFKILRPFDLFNYNQKMERKRDEKIFEGKRLLFPNRPLLKDDFKLKCIEINSNAIHKDNISCIRLKKEAGYAKDYTAYLGILNSKFSGYFVYHTSSQWDTGAEKRDKIKNSDIENIPIPIFAEIETLQIKEQVKEIYQSEDLSNTNKIENKIDELVFDLYDLKEYEKEIIREFYEIKVERGGKKEKLLKDSDIKRYADKFIEVFSLMLKQGNKLVAVKYHISKNVGTVICFTIINEDEALPFFDDQALEILDFVKNRQLKETDTTKILNEEKVKIYDGKQMYIVKSNLFKDWTTRQAIKDADEEIGLLLSKLPSRA